MFEPYRLIQKIAATGSRIEKDALIRELAQTEDGVFVLKWTYDPFITYGLKPKLYQSEGGRLMAFRPQIVKVLLERLASRDLTGKAAEREVWEVMNALDADGADMLFRILSKDLKCGIAEASINVAVPGLIPTFSVMRAQPYEEKKVAAWPVKVEPKLDGNRNTFLCRGGKGGFFTRSGRVVPALDHLVEPVLGVARVAAKQGSRELFELLTNRECDLSKNIDDTLSFMLDGEAMVGLFADSGVLRRKDAQATDAELHLYDILSYADFNADGTVGPAFDARRRLLGEFVRFAKHLLGKDGPIQIVPQYFANDDAEVQVLFEQMRNRTLASYLARGDGQREQELLKTTIDAATGKPKTLEGAMVKRIDAHYQKRKCNDWLKLKGEETEDLRVIGAYPGEPHTKYAHCLGGLEVDRNGVTVRVGGGFTDEERESLWRLYQSDVGNPYFGEEPAKWPLNARPKLLGRLIEVEFHEVTPDGSLRHPRFLRFRDDKEREAA